MKNQASFQLTLIAAALAAFQGSAWAQETSDEIKVLTKPESEVSLGVGQQWHARQQLGKYDGMQTSGTYYQLDANIIRRDDQTGTSTEISVRNLGLDTLEAGLRLDQQGNWGGSLDYDRLVSNNPNTFMTGLRGIGTSTLTYGAIGTNATTANAGLYPAKTEVHLGTTRDTLAFSAYKYLAEGLSMNISLKEEEKKGTRHWGRGVNPEFAVEPIDSTTTQIEAVLNFAADKYQMNGGYALSRYKNNNSFVDTIGGSTTNPAPAATNTSDAQGHTFLSLPLDNVAHQLFANGGYNFTDKTRGTFKASYSVATQNDSLAPITNAFATVGATGPNGIVPFSPGTPASLDGKVETKLVELGLTTKPIDKLTVVANARYHSRNDKTPLREYGNYWAFRCTGSGTTTQYAGGPDAPTNATCTALGVGNLTAAAGSYTGPANTIIENNPRDFKNLAGKLEATYRLPMGYNVTGGVNLDRRERTYETNAATGEYEGVVKMRSKTDELTWNLQVRRALSESMNGTVALQHAKRTGSTWHAAEGVAEAGHPINFVNPAPFADRKKNKVRASADWAPADNMQFQFTAEAMREKYESGPAGVKDGSSSLLAVDANIAVTDNWQLVAWAAQDVTKTHQTNYTYDTRTTSATSSTVGAAAAALNPNWYCTTADIGTPAAGFCATPTDLIWDAKLKDTGRSIGIGLRGRVMPKLSVGGDVNWTETVSAYAINSNVPNLVAYTGGTVATPAVTQTAASKQGIPDITSTTIRVALFGQYAIEKTSDLRIDLVYTQWKTDDWTAMMWNNAGTALVPFTYMDGTRVVSNQSQNSTFAGVKYIYRFQ